MIREIQTIAVEELDILVHLFFLELKLFFRPTRVFASGFFPWVVGQLCLCLCCPQLCVVRLCVLGIECVCDCVNFLLFSDVLQHNIIIAYGARDGRVVSQLSPDAWRARRKVSKFQISKFESRRMRTRIKWRHHFSPFKSRICFAWVNSFLKLLLLLVFVLR